MDVWVTRPVPGLAKTAAALRAAGHTSIEAPVLEVVTVPPQPRPQLPWPDWLILVSANAARGLEAARAHIGQCTEQTRVAAVGRRTAAAWRELGWRIDLVPEDECAQGLIAAFARQDMSGQRVWIPAGDRAGSANRDLPEALAGMGATVEVFRVYQTRQRDLTAHELDALAGHSPDAVLVYSPSAAEAIFAGTVPDAAQAWRERAVAIAIGPITRVRLEQLGVTRISEAPEPSDSGAIEALAAIAEKKP